MAAELKQSKELSFKDEEKRRTAQKIVKLVMNRNQPTSELHPDVIQIVYKYANVNHNGIETKHDAYPYPSVESVQPIEHTGGSVSRP